MATADQSAALQNALARAKEIAAKLQQQGAATATASSQDTDESRKRALPEVAAFNGEPFSKRSTVDDPNDPKTLAMQVAQTLVNRAGLGSMFQEEMMIPNRFVGLVIGRGGEMINKLQVDTSARIQVAPDPPPDRAHEDRQLTLTGTPDAVGKAKQVIEKIVNDGKVPDSMNVTSGEFSIEYMVPTQKVGLVIGKGGETIRSLQERAGCKMVLIQDGPFSNQTEKPLRITGEQQKCAYGKQLVVDLLTAKELETIHPEGPQPDKQNVDGSITTEYLVPKESVGFVIGRSGETIKKVQDQSNCRVQFKNDMQGSQKAAVLTGTQEQIDAAKALIDDIVKNGNRPRGGPGQGGPRWSGPRGPPQFGGEQSGGWGGNASSGGFGGGRGGGDRPSRMPSTPLQPGEKMMDIKVPRNKCGLIIGKGGETIRSISTDTEIFIEMNRTVPEEAPFRVFSMRGFEAKIRQAEQIIRDKIGDPTCQAVEVGSGPEDPSSQFGGAPAGAQWPGAPQQVWGQRPGGEQWNQHQQPQQAAWSQPPQQAWDPQAQQGAPWQPQPQQPWQQQQPQPGQPQPPWQQQQPQAPQNQWGAQQAPQQQPQAPVAVNPGQPQVDPNAAAAAASGGQPDYTQAWQAYYQQYYAQFGNPASAAGGTVGTVVAPATATAGVAVPIPIPQPQAPVPVAQPVTAQQPDYTAEWQRYYQQYYPGYAAGGAAPVAAPVQPVQQQQQQQ